MIGNGRLSTPGPQRTGKVSGGIRVFHPLPAPPPWQVQAIRGAGEDLVISFASIGHDPAQVPAPEFVSSASAGNRTALFLSDASRSWCSSSGFAEVVIAAFTEAKIRRPAGRVLLIGHSMGAFAALVAASVIAADAVLAIGPQYSVDPCVMPQETRWADWTGRIARFDPKTAPLPEGPSITLMHGMADDLPQALAFPERKDVDHILYPGLTHSALAPHLKARGCLPGLIEAALAGDRRRLLRIAASAGGIRRSKLKDQLPR